MNKTARRGMKRVVVIGCPGSGKTTFTRAVADRLHLPAVHLDGYYHQKEHDYYNDQPAWLRQVKDLAAGSRWIMDGNYASILSLRLQRADTVIFFDFPKHMSLYGVVKRAVQHRNKHRAEMPSDWQETINWEFIKFVWNFRRDMRGQTVQALEEANAPLRLVTLKNRKQVKAYLATLS